MLASENVKKWLNATFSAFFIFEAAFSSSSSITVCPAVCFSAASYSILSYTKLSIRRFLPASAGVRLSYLSALPMVVTSNIESQPSSGCLSPHRI